MHKKGDESLYQKTTERQKFTNDVTSGTAEVLVKTDDRVELGTLSTLCM